MQAKVVARTWNGAQSSTSDGVLREATSVQKGGRQEHQKKRKSPRKRGSEGITAWRNGRLGGCEQQRRISIAPGWLHWEF